MTLKIVNQSQRIAELVSGTHTNGTIKNLTPENKGKLVDLLNKTFDEGTLLETHNQHPRNSDIWLPQEIIRFERAEPLGFGVNILYTVATNGNIWFKILDFEKDPKYALLLSSNKVVGFYSEQDYTNAAGKQLTAYLIHS